MNTTPAGPAGADTADAARTGWFGKIPALGDFVVRRLPEAFVDAWDAWLSTELAAAQDLLGPQFAPIYDRAPAWCFALAPGVIGAGWWYGAWMPSADRVGRRFPLTFALGSAAPLDAPAVPWAACVAAGLASRDASQGAPQIDEALRSASGAPPADEVVARLRTLAAGLTLWWPAGTDLPDGAGLHGCAHLPAGVRFLDLLCAGGPSRS
jgi:type VI secretion system protein ImpM